MGNVRSEMTVRERVDALGWRGQPFPTVFANIVWQYLSARLDEKVPLRLIEGEGVHDASRDRECCERALEGMLNEAQRVGLLDLLQCPQQVRDSDEVLSILQRVFGRSMRSAESGLCRLSGEKQAFSRGIVPPLVGPGTGRRPRSGLATCARATRAGETPARFRRQSPRIRQSGSRRTSRQENAARGHRAVAMHNPRGEVAAAAGASRVTASEYCGCTASVRDPRQRAGAGPESCLRGTAAPSRGLRSARSNSGVW